MAEQFNNTDEKEIDFSIVGDKLKGLAAKIDDLFFRFIMFIKRNIIVIAILFIAGAALGYYNDSKGKSYNNEIIVIPNFGSTEHLYSQIELIQAKINERDTAFLKQIGLTQPKKLLKIEIESINNVYSFASQNTTNFELIKLMAEDGSINKVIEDETTSKNYANHRINFLTKGVFPREIMLDPLLAFFNSSSYFDTIKKQQIINIETKMRLNDSIVAQIDDIIKEFKTSPSSGARSSSLVYYNENTQLSEILKRKEDLINEQAMLRISKINYTSIIKETGSSLNILNKKGLSGKYKYILPFIFVSLFLMIGIFVRYIKRGLKRNGN